MFFFKKRNQKTFGPLSRAGRTRTLRLTNVFCFFFARKKALLLCLVSCPALAANVTITRDDWGIAHVHGHTDADAVFGMIYAQAEDDFNRIEMNYLTALGRMSEAVGERALAQDLRARLYIDPAELKARYAQSPEWLRRLMAGWAGGLNVYLAQHPGAKPKVLTHFEPWMALAFSEGSIGGDIERIDLPNLAAFYGLPRPPGADEHAELHAPEPAGSNGIAIAPANTRDHHALLLINPHTSFYFRSELQMSSDEGLNAYGAATWGQFFLYQGFNEHLGWMHPSSTMDAVDSFLETIVHQGAQTFTRYGDGLRPVQASNVTIAYRKPDGSLDSKDFTIYKTTHGPVVAKLADGRWVSEAMMFRPVAALAQAFSLTKARDYTGFFEAMELKANTSNNTVYADADGHIAFMLPQFIPKRDDRFDYTKPVDGANPATDWQGLHALADAPHVLDPATGFIQNTNNWPYSVSGAASPKAADYPRYMDTDGENVRGLHALTLLSNRQKFTLESLVTAAFDAGQPGFDILIPDLLNAYAALPPDDPMHTRLSGQMKVLRLWDHRSGELSVATSLAVYWGEALWHDMGMPISSERLRDYQKVLAKASNTQLLTALVEASDRLTRDFGTWNIAWGEINRFQRTTDDLIQPFDDSKPSLPVGFTSGQWGSLAAISGPTMPGVKKRYGTDGNSFVAAVEFGPRVRALAVTAGGESGDPASPHFDDEALRYTTGLLRKVYFYPDELAGHVEREEQVKK
jgi:acyl-homoserine-lactone acylase